MDDHQLTWAALATGAMAHCRHFVAHYHTNQRLKGIDMSTTSPIIQAIENDLPALIRGTKAVVKVLLDTIYTTGTPDEKAAQLTAQLEPGFNQGLAQLGLPTWALGMIDGIFAKLVAVTVAAIEAT